MKTISGSYTIDTDQDKIDIFFVHAFLSESYWSPGIRLETVERSIKCSLPFGLYQGHQQIGFARVISDFTTFAYLADVFIEPSSQGKGLGKWLVETVLAHPDLQGLRRFMLATRDAHELYAKFGFGPLIRPERFMQK